MSTYDTIIRLVGRDQGASDALRKVKGETQGLKESTGLLDKAMGAAAAMGFAVLARKAADLVFDLAVLGAEAARVEDAFRRVSAGVGASADGILAAMDNATAHIVDDEALMQVATNAMIMGLQLSEAQWAQLAEGARYHARLIGATTEEVFSGVVEAITRGQPRMLAALKFPGARDAINEMAEDLDGAASSMTEAERSAALFNLTLGVMTGEMGKFGEISDDMIDDIDRTKVSWENLKESIGQGLGKKGGFFQGLYALTEALQGNAEPMQAANAEAERLIPVIDLLGKRSWATGRQIAFSNGYLREAVGLFPKAAEEGARFGRSMGTVAGEVDEVYNALRHMTQAQLDASLTPTVSLYQKTPYERPYEGVTNIDWAKKGEDNASDYMDAWQTAWDDLRSTVESALQASSVTIEDMAAATSGSYVDKWDENIRRLNAVAERGFAELTAHPDWATALDIPADVLAGTEAQLKAWAAGTAKTAPPTMFDIDAAVAMVEQYVAEQAAHEALIDAVAKAYAAKHGVSVGAAKDSLAGVLGDPAEQGKSIADKFGAGFTDQLKDSSPATLFVTAMDKDIAAQAVQLKALGISLWLAAEVGIKRQMEDSNYVLMFATILAPIVAKLLNNPYE